MVGAATLGAALAALAVAALDATAGLSATARTRSVDPEGAPSGRRMELELGPRVEGSVRHGRSSVSGRLELRAVAPVAGVAGPFLDADRVGRLAAAEVRAEIPAVRAWRLAGALNGAYGVTDLLAGDVWLPQAVPTTSLVPYLSTEGRLALTGGPSARTRFHLEAGASVSGGADEAARATIPLQRGVAARAGMDRGLTPRDALTMSLSATGARFSTGASSGHAAVELGYRRQASPHVALTAGGGVAGIYDDRPDDAGGDVSPAATASGSVSWAPGGDRPASSLTLRVQPAVDRLTGAAALRAEASATVSLVPGSGWTLEGRGAGAQVRPSGGSVGSLELRATRRFGRFADVSTGVYGTWQRSERPELPSFFEWGSFLGVSAWRGRARG